MDRLIKQIVNADHEIVKANKKIRELESELNNYRECYEGAVSEVMRLSKQVKAYQMTNVCSCSRH